MTLSLSDTAVTLVGELFVPQAGTVIDVCNDARRFINLRNVRFRDSVEAYGLLTVGKAQAELGLPDDVGVPGASADGEEPRSDLRVRMSRGELQHARPSGWSSRHGKRGCGGSHDESIEVSPDVYVALRSGLAPDESAR